MKKYALDSNIISYLLGEDKRIIRRIKAEKDNGTVIKIPPFVYFEIRRGLLYLKAAKKIATFDLMYNRLVQ